METVVSTLASTRLEGHRTIGSRLPIAYETINSIETSILFPGALRPNSQETSLMMNVTRTYKNRELKGCLFRESAGFETGSYPFCPWYNSLSLSAKPARWRTTPLLRFTFIILCSPAGRVKSVSPCSLCVCLSHSIQRSATYGPATWSHKPTTLYLTPPPTCNQQQWS